MRRTWLAAVVLWGVDGYAAHGTPEEPGTSLLTLTTPPGADGVFTDVHVVEVEHGDGAAAVLDADALASPLLVGGFHGAWVHPRDVPGLEWSSAALGEVGARLGAGALLSLSDGSCPVSETARYTSYLAGESAGRWGPAATACRPWPPRCSGWPMVPTPGAGCASWPGWSPAAAPAPTPTAPPGWSAHCSPRSRTTSRRTSTTACGCSTREPVVELAGGSDTRRLAVQR